MSLHKKLSSIFELLTILYADGKNKVKLKQNEHKVDTEDILFLLNRTLPISNLSYMQEFLQKNNQMNSKIKSISYKKNSHNTSSSQILDLVSTTKEKDLTKFWTNFSQTISNKLWLPLKTDFLDSTSNFSKTYSLDSMRNLKLYLQKNMDLHMKNSQRISCRSLRSSQPDTTVRETILKTRKIRIYPTKKQKEFYNKCFGTTRFIYNEIVKLIKNNNEKVMEKIKKQVENGCAFYNKNNKKYCCNNLENKYFCKKHKNNKIDFGFSLSLASLRKNSKLFTKNYIKKNPWLNDIPYDTRQLIINDFITAYKAAITNYKKGNISNFQMKFKSKKQLSQFFHIDKRAIKKDVTIFKRKKLGETRLRKKEKRWYQQNINDELKHNCKIIRYKTGAYYLLLTIEEKQKEKKSNFECVSLDPGIRTFQTFYSPGGLVGKIGDNFSENHLSKIANRIDKLDSTKSKIKNKRKKENIRKRQFLLRTKIKNVITDLHWKTAHFLCKNFETIIIPKFGCKKMSNKKNSINSKITRKMLLLSHGSFLEKLKFKCKEFRKNLIVVNECYTSKTCTKCGTIKNGLKGNKIFKCSKCGLKIDRDYNGARNILLKTVTTAFKFF